jgi:hypothetical protein
MAIKKNWSPFDTFALFDGNRIFLIAKKGGMSHVTKKMPQAILW